MNENIEIHRIAKYIAISLVLFVFISITRSRNCEWTQRNLRDDTSFRVSVYNIAILISSKEPSDFSLSLHISLSLALSINFSDSCKQICKYTLQDLAHVLPSSSKVASWLFPLNEPSDSLGLAPVCLTRLLDIGEVTSSLPECRLRRSPDIRSHTLSPGERSPCSRRFSHFRWQVHV